MGLLDILCKNTYLFKKIVALLVMSILSNIYQETQFFLAYLFALYRVNSAMNILKLCFKKISLEKKLEPEPYTVQVK